MLHPFSFNVSKYGFEPANLQNTKYVRKIQAERNMLFEGSTNNGKKKIRITITRRPIRKITHRTRTVTTNKITFGTLFK